MGTRSGTWRCSPPEWSRRAVRALARVRRDSLRSPSLAWLRGPATTCRQTGRSSSASKQRSDAMRWRPQGDSTVGGKSVWCSSSMGSPWRRSSLFRQVRSQNPCLVMVAFSPRFPTASGPHGSKRIDVTQTRKKTDPSKQPQRLESRLQIGGPIITCRQTGRSSFGLRLRPKAGRRGLSSCTRRRYYKLS